MTTYILIAAVGILLLVYLAFVARMVAAPKQMSQVVKLIESGNTRQAIKGLKAMLSRNEHNPLAHWYLGEAYYKEGKNELAVVECKFVLRINKFSNDISEIKVRERLAALYEGFGQAEEAQKEYILLSRLNPDKAQYHFKIGEIFYKRNYTDKAVAYFQTAIKLMPAHADTLVYLGMIHYSKGQVREALDAFNKALHYNP
jgi:tetratricopeptide (TPR) repeat protein